MNTVTYFKTNGVFITFKLYFYPRWFNQTYSVLKGIFNKRYKQHRRNAVIATVFINIRFNMNIRRRLYAQFLQGNIIFKVLNLAGHRYKLEVIFKQHKPHHITKLLYSFGSSTTTFLQGCTVQCV